MQDWRCTNAKNSSRRPIFWSSRWQKKEKPKKQTKFKTNISSIMYLSSWVPRTSTEEQLHISCPQLFKIDASWVLCYSVFLFMSAPHEHRGTTTTDKQSSAIQNNWRLTMRPMLLFKIDVSWVLCYSVFLFTSALHEHQRTTALKQLIAIQNWCLVSP